MTKDLDYNTIIYHDILKTWSHLITLPYFFTGSFFALAYHQCNSCYRIFRRKNVVGNVWKETKNENSYQKSHDMRQYCFNNKSDADDCWVCRWSGMESESFLDQRHAQINKPRFVLKLIINLFCGLINLYYDL